uniref:Uncharacterized protein n=1 Tax=Rangifer tarandus platyrhynchus TaxID=3082113 RepID=A0ACB0F3M2_RANTA|nr:unnamed protein product [Rangifer tarandus platyrhynchus]
MLKLTSKAERKLRSRWVSPAEESAGGKAPEARRGLPRGPQEAPQDEEGRGSRRPLEPGEQGDRRGDDIILPHDAPGPVGGAGESCPPLPHRCLPEAARLRAGGKRRDVGGRRDAFHGVGVAAARATAGRCWPGPGPARRPPRCPARPFLDGWLASATLDGPLILRDLRPRACRPPLACRDTPATLRSPRRSRAREGGPTSGDALTLKQAAARHPRDLGDGNIPGVYSGRAPFAWTLPRPRTPGRKAKERRRPGSPAQPGGAALGERGSRPPGGRDKAGDGGSA